MAVQQSDRYIERVDGPEYLKFIDFVDDCAEIDVPGSALESMPFELQNFVEDQAYWDAVDDIRNNGYDWSTPIRLEPRPGGRWVVDALDSSRFAAAKTVVGEFFSNLFTQKVSKVRFLLMGSSCDGQFKATRHPFHQDTH
jgi:hypothetical protein